MWLLVAIRAEGRPGFSNGGDRPTDRARHRWPRTTAGPLAFQRNVAERACDGARARGHARPRRERLPKEELKGTGAEKTRR